MMLGLSFESFTLFHMALSLIGIASGFMVVGGMLSNNRMPCWTALFLGTTVLTGVTGFMFPFGQLLPSHIVGAISLVVLAAAIAAFYAYRLAGAWRWIYVVGAMTALYFNVFVGVVQAFAKFPGLNALAPTQSEPAFAISHTVVLIVFVGLGIAAARKFHPAAAPS